MKRHFYEHARVRLDRLGTAALTRFYQGIEQGNWPEQIGRTKELDREVQMVSSPDDFQVVISEDPGRDHVFICARTALWDIRSAKRFSSHTTGTLFGSSER